MMKVVLIQINYKNIFKDEGITHKITMTHANVAERMIGTLKKMISDRLQIHKGSWTIMLKPVLDKYNSKMVHSTTGLTPNEAHKDENSIEVKADSVMNEKYLRNYPNINLRLVTMLECLLKVRVITAQEK